MEYDAFCRSKLRQKLRTLRHILPYEGRLVRPILPLTGACYYGTMCRNFWSMCWNTSILTSDIFKSVLKNGPNHEKINISLSIYRHVGI